MLELLNPPRPRRFSPPSVWLGQIPRPTRAVDLLVAFALILSAAAIRLPYLLRYPHFTDETVEGQWAFDIWHGVRWPLTGSDAYYGPLHSYIVAAALWLFGPHLLLPRFVVLAIGALTIGVTYLLGRELHSRAAGIVAAALLATAPQHIIVNSHVAWANATTPFYAAVCCWGFARFLHRERGGYLLLSGVFFGLTLHTHPGTIILLPALVAAFAYAVARRRSWGLLRRPWPYLATALALVAYSPVLIYNVGHGFAGLVRVQTRRSYAYEIHPSWGSYRHNLANIGLEIVRTIANPTQLPQRRWEYLSDPHLMIVAALCIAGLIILTRRREPLPLFALFSTLLIMPRFNHAYGVEGDRFILTGRYIGFLLPLLMVAIAVTAVTLATIVWNTVTHRWRNALRTALLSLIVALVLYPLLPLARYYQREVRRDPDNASFLATVRLVGAARAARTPVFIDEELDRINLHDGASASEVLDYLLTLNRVAHAVVEVRSTLHELIANQAPADAASAPLIIMTRHQYSVLREELPLTRVSPPYRLIELYPDLPSYYAVYRYTPSPSG